MVSEALAPNRTLKRITEDVSFGDASKLKGEMWQNVTMKSCFKTEVIFCVRLSILLKLELHLPGSSPPHSNLLIEIVSNTKIDSNISGLAQFLLFLRGIWI